jgi:hypothetical protein
MFFVLCCVVEVKVNLNLNVIATKTVVDLVVVVMFAIVRRSISLFENFWRVLA